MNKHIKVVIGAVIMAGVLWAGLGIYRASSSQASKTIVKIGVIAPLTGDLAFIGEGYKNAIMLAQEESKDSKYAYELFFEDDQYNPSKTSSAVNKLVFIDKVDVVISLGSGPGNVINPIAEKNKVIQFATAASDPTVAKGDYNFIHWTPASEEGKVFVEELRKRGIKKLGVLALNHPWPMAEIAAIEKNIQGTDIQIVTNQKFNEDERDFKSIIAKIKNSGAEIYLIEATSPQLEIVVKQMKDMGVTAPITSIESFDASNNPALFNGLWYVSVADPTSGFMGKYKNKYGKDATLATANGYDIFKLVAAAYENTDGKRKPLSEDVVKQLHAIKNFAGALGNLSVNADGIVESQATVKIIKEGKAVPFSQ
ncbi:MAG: hypothetical protein ACD_81C00203G0002 [uncultured bacterium]|uniref:Leucine-, isoleucine-, valine-, threonine-, and alanine-binding protein n=1 Tax=Candidatus Wolfebacteria bacterium GW2011_GWC2_39_22 TaxID=1619013 RepID=A0A0G0QPD1_9BACT|nr:MAG: hypothetical protein ACD_81C00203G0002 [uncultured bacterium]KKR12255.1 MAG: Leucine-, isoleucine-, valine-, threonine-, and alanine-binding protein [Candidatus Wolfebacteria bacterium GW2011_GWC2_39_22]HBI25890.1 hypothetical protein [Candidatus Wolfebacteria bacterium]